MGIWRDFWYGPEPERAQNAPEQRSQDITIPPAPGGVIPPRPAGDGVTTTSALSLAEVYRAISIIQAAVGQLTPDVWRGNTPAVVPSWLRRPDMKTSRSGFLAQTATSLATSGNAFWRVMRDDSTAPVQALIVQNPFDVMVNVNGRGETISYGIAGYDREFRPWEMSHMKLLEVPGSARGLGPIQAARQDIKGALDLRDYASEFFDTGDVPNGILSTAQPLTDIQADAYRTRWEGRGHGTAVLGSGLQYVSNLLSPEDAQFLQSRDFSAVQIARLFGIPARLMLVDAGSSNDYQNTQDSDLSFIRWGLSSYYRPIEEAFSDLLPRGTTAQMNLDAFTRPAITQRYAAHAVALGYGFLTVNEVRAIEGLAPISGGDVLSKQTATPPAQTETSEQA
jgi:HK97 family phage portal protein